MANRLFRYRKNSVLPGFRLTLGFTLFYLGLIVLIPLGAVFWKTSTLTWSQFWQTISMPTAMASYRLTFGASFLAALVNAFFGLIVAWVLVRYEFFGKKIIDSLVDLPFALPTAVAGITLASLYAQNGWIGQLLAPLGIKVANTQIGVFIALTFIGLPFIVRTVQPILEDLGAERRLDLSLVFDLPVLTGDFPQVRTLRAVVDGGLDDLVGFHQLLERVLGEELPRRVHAVLEQH